jgi:DNA-directed RNA polymerase I subunit RPA2
MPAKEATPAARRAPGPTDTSDPRYQVLKRTQVGADEKEVPAEYQRLVEPHLASFDFFVTDGLELVVDLMPTFEVG